MLKDFLNEAANLDYEKIYVMLIDLIYRVDIVFLDKKIFEEQAEEADNLEYLTEEYFLPSILASLVYENSSINYVISSAAKDNFGPLLYDVLLIKTNIDGKEGVRSDTVLTNDAVKIYEKYLELGRGATGINVKHQQVFKDRNKIYNYIFSTDENKYPLKLNFLPKEYSDDKYIVEHVRQSARLFFSKQYKK